MGVKISKRYTFYSFKVFATKRLLQTLDGCQGHLGSFGALF